MKLETEMQDGCVHALGCCIDEDDVMPTVAKHLQHDVAAAHALMQALGEFAGDHTNLPLCITRRADEILAEWGYGDE